MDRSPAYYLFLTLIGIFVPVLLIFGMCELDSALHPDRSEQHYQQCLKAGGSYKTGSDVHGSSWYCVKGDVVFP